MEVKLKRTIEEGLKVGFLDKLFGGKNKQNQDEQQMIQLKIGIILGSTRETSLMQLNT
ncbi:hypothetical protein ACIQ34_07095 [Ureibacillus sp. NPDC094379]